MEDGNKLEFINLKEKSREIKKKLGFFLFIHEKVKS